MIPNDFIFADLSTYHPKEAMAFYEAVFGWTFWEEGGYYMAYRGSRAVVGLYQTPAPFKARRMPHFWMSYIRVEDLQKTVEKAKALGGIIEMVEENNPIGGVALIRDLQGAGFTIYAGNQLQSTKNQWEAHTLVWNELHVSDAKAVLPFYQGIFNWSFQVKAGGHYEIYNARQAHIADIREVANAYKGKYEYWVCTFAVPDLAQARAKVMEHGGSILATEGNRLLVADQGAQAFFYLMEVGG